ncbi:protein-tyrosine phosphatase-like protein [Podospora appendiculata]|uniref:protein-tyrosine-phosphatase n=1 Tax=Podospora appendiculata TaxID=314037 RepID=A0AAE1CCY1_9PEZI|nr:protein-tyrosine phosphatase-like protein [Podospora appendiculata]
MALNRVNGPEDIYIGGVFSVRRARLVEEFKITHVLSVIQYALNPEEETYRTTEHMSIDIDDMEDSDILVHLPSMVRFIEKGLYGEAALPENRSRASRQTASETTTDDPDAITPADADQTAAHDAPFQPAPSQRQTGAVLVHCAMGKSRSVTAVVAYLLWKHPHRFGRSDPTTTSRRAVKQAVNWIRETRAMAEPNDGFMRQLELWWDMGCPANSDDAVEKEPGYQRWAYNREVDDAVRVGRAPDYFRFEDEEAAKTGRFTRSAHANGIGAAAAIAAAELENMMELRCKKCRRMLATKPFVIPHQGKGNAEKSDCGHFFVEPLSWMRPILEGGELEGRLYCPNTKCSASVGRYSWRGFKCSCGEWIAPAFSLQNSRVDEVMTGGTRADSAKVNAARRAAMGIRMPPGAAAAAAPKENL